MVLTWQVNNKKVIHFHNGCIKIGEILMKMKHTLTDT